MSESMPSDEEWRTVPDHPNYEVSSYGRVLSHKSGKPRLLTPYTHKKLGYVRIAMDGVGVSVHRAEAAAWHGPCPDGKEVDHINRVRDDNRPENLRYLTRQENMARMVLPPPPTHCPAKHPLSGDNLYVRPNGHRQCRLCSTLRLQVQRQGSSSQQCSADGCVRGAYTRRAADPLCEMHYQRVNRAKRRAAAA